MVSLSIEIILRKRRLREGAWKRHKGGLGAWCNPRGVEYPWSGDVNSLGLVINRGKRT